jgi:stress response protein YsnF
VLSEERRVTGTVRREQVRIEAEGDIEIIEHT